MIERTLRGMVATLFAALVMSSATTNAQSVEDSPRAMLYLAIGGAGETELETDPSVPILDGSAADNEATVGVGARFEMPIMEYVAIGAQIELLSYELDGSDRHVSGHFDLWVKGRYVYELSSDLTLEGYLGVPIGFSTVSIEENAALKRENNNLGWNIGLLAGSQLFFNDRFGAMLEMGWRRIEVYNEDTTSNYDLSATSNQFVLNLGGVFLF